MSEFDQEHLQLRHSGAERLLSLSQTIRTDYCERYEASRDERAVFAFVYAQMTENLAHHLQNPDLPFDDPEWITTLAEAFALRFIVAMKAIDDWLALKTNDIDALYAAVPKPWADVYLAIRNKQSYVLEDMVFSMMAHISFDLPLTLLEVGMDKDGQSHINDFHRMNDVLAGVTEEMQKIVGRRYTRFLGSFDKWAGRYDEFFTNYGIRVARSVAWYNAQRLLDPASHEEALHSIERTTADFIRYIREPKDTGHRLLLLLTRLFIPRRRYWP